MAYSNRIMAAGNVPRSNQVKIFGRHVLESTPAPVKRLMFADVGDTGEGMGFVLAMDTTGGLAFVDGSVNKLLGARVVVFAGRVAVGEESPVVFISAEFILVVKGLGEVQAVFMAVRLMTVNPVWLVSLITPEPARPSN